MTIQKQSKGFTLIEVLVVIGIIAVLAGVVLVAVNPARQFAQANNAQRSANVNAILNAVGQMIVDNKGFIPGATTTPTTSLAGQIMNTFRPISDSGVNLCNFVVPGYIPALPVDPTQTPFDGCPTTYTTGYEIMQETDGRIIIRAPQTQLCSNVACPADEQISVSR